jgi:hypothetical protein
MEIQEQKYNQPINYLTSINNHIIRIIPELVPYLDDIGFIYAGMLTNYNLMTRSDENIIEQISEYNQLGKKVIIFDGIDEGTALSTVEKIYSVVSIAEKIYSNIKFYYMNGAHDGQRDVDRYFLNKGIVSNFSVISVAYFEYYNDRISSELGPAEYKLGSREKIFCCLNRVMRLHRGVLLDSFIKNDMVNEKCYYSFHDSSRPDGGVHELILERYPYHNLFPNMVKNLELVKTLRLNWDDERLNPTDIRQEDHRLYNNSYFSVITETIFYDPDTLIKKIGYLTEPTSGLFFSEKIFKPMIMLHPFIIVAAPFALKALRERGFKTFAPYIDETYDTIVDDDERLDAIVTEVKNLSKKTEAEWEEWCKNIKPIVEHNYRQLRENKKGTYITNQDLIGKLFTD